MTPYREQVRRRLNEGGTPGQITDEILSLDPNVVYTDIAQLIEEIKPTVPTTNVTKTATPRVSFNKWAMFCGRSQIVFTDRYDALGMAPPDTTTMCDGQCDGTGFVPISADDREEPWATLWKEAEEEEHSEDGWQFVTCPDCTGSGKRVAQTVDGYAATEDGLLKPYDPPVVGQDDRLIEMRRRKRKRMNRE
jgi:hypothetical protein